MNAGLLFSFCNLTVPFIEAHCSALFNALLHPINSVVPPSPHLNCFPKKTKKFSSDVFRFKEFIYRFVSISCRAALRFSGTFFFIFEPEISSRSGNVCGSARLEGRRNDRSADVYLYFSFYYLLARSDETFSRSPHSNQLRVVYSRLSTFSFCAPLLFTILNDGIMLRFIQIDISYYVIDCKYCI